MTPQTISRPTPPARSGFRHEALLYAGDDDFVTRVGRFVADGVMRDEPVLVIVDARKIDVLRDELGADAARVAFADMTEVGHNPARIIPVWESFVRDATRRGVHARGVGEPVWAGRSPDELAECHIHESLINVAFAGAPMWLVCPYDTATLEPDAVDEALRNHPYVAIDGSGFASDGYSVDVAPRPLAPPPGDAVRFDYDFATLRILRDFVARRAERLGLPERAREAFVFVTNELATNSVRHGGGRGTLTLWRSGGRVICETFDRGWIRDPLVGRVEPRTDGAGGRGVWLANRLCDLVQIRTAPDGTTVRVHLAI